jgi:hypothetical protein
MVILIVLNIILIITLVFLLIYLFNIKKDDIKNVCVNNNTEDKKYTQDNKKDSCRLFDGIFVTDEEYQHIMKSRRGGVSISFNEVEREYEYFKELNK